MATASKKTNGKASAVSAADLEEQITTLREELGTLTKTIAELAKAKGEETVADAKSKADDVREDAVDQVQAQTAALQDMANDFLNKQPATALGIAAGLGFLIGFLGSRR